MSYIPEIKYVGEDRWIASIMRFATAGEAINYATNLQHHGVGWKVGLKNRRAVESDDRVTHRWTLKGLETKETT